MKWDLKSILTLIMASVLALVVIALVASVIFKLLPSDDSVVNAIVLLFSNVTTMVFTYFFSKKSGGDTNVG